MQCVSYISFTPCDSDVHIQHVLRTTLGRKRTPDAGISANLEADWSQSHEIKRPQSRV